MQKLKLTLPQNLGKCKWNHSRHTDTYTQEVRLYTSGDGHTHVYTLTLAVLSASIPVVAMATVLTRLAISVVQASETGASAGIAGHRVLHVNVAVTPAWVAPST